MGINEWWQIVQQLSKHWHLNWVNATLFKFDFELELVYGRQLSMNLVFLGLGVYVQITLAPPTPVTAD